MQTTIQVFDGLQELEDAVGTHLGYSDWHLVTQEEIDLFAEATGDHQWIHVDREKAKEGPFGRTIAHGFLTLSFVPMFAADVYRVGGVKMGLNYGCNKVRFTSPVPVDSRIRGGVEIVSLEPRAGGATLTTRVTITCEGAEKPSCIAEMLVLLFP